MDDFEYDADTLRAARDPSAAGVIRRDQAESWLKEHPALGTGEYAEQLANMREPMRPHVMLQAEYARATEEMEKEGALGIKTAPSFLAERAVPFASTGLKFAMGRAYQGAKQRFGSGTADDQDIKAIADYEVRQKFEAEKGLGATALSAAAHIPAILGEAAVAAPAVRGLGLSPALLRGSAGAGELAVSQIPRSAMTALGLSARAVGGTLAQTAMMPSMYLSQSQERALAHGGEFYEAKNLGPALTTGAMQVSLLGAIGRVPGGLATSYPTTMGMAGRALTSEGVAGWASRWIAGTTTGLTGQQIIDLGTHAAKWNTSWGAVPDLIAGREGATKRLVSEAVVFSLFSALHAHHNPKIGADVAEMKRTMDWVQKAADAYGRSFEPGDQAAAERGADILGDAMKGALTPERVADMPEGPEKSLAQKLTSGPVKSASEALAEDAAQKAAQNAPKPPIPPEPPPATEPAQAPMPKPGTPEATAAGIKDVFGAMGEGIGEASKQKVESYAQRILNGEKDVLQGLNPEGAFAKSVQARVAELQAKPTASEGLTPEEHKDVDAAMKQHGLKPDSPLRPMYEGAVLKGRNAPRGPQVIQPEARPPIPENVAKAITDVLPEARPVERFGKTVPNEMEVTVGGRRITLEHDAEQNTIRVDFTDIRPEKAGVGANVERGSLETMRAVRSIMSALSKTGVDVEYTALDAASRGTFRTSRAELYAKMMEKAGYELVKGPEPDSPNPTYRWRAAPEAPVEPKGPEQTANLQSRPEPFKLLAEPPHDNAIPQHIQEAIDRANLTPREKAVLENLAKGNSHGDLEASFGVKRQRVQQIEKDAMAKIGTKFKSMAEWQKAGVTTAVGDTAVIDPRVMEQMAVRPEERPSEAMTAKEIEALSPELRKLATQETADVPDEGLWDVIDKEFNIPRTADLDAEIAKDPSQIQEIADAIERDARAAERRGENPASVRRTTLQRLQALRAKARAAVAFEGTPAQAEGDAGPTEAPASRSGEAARGVVTEAPNEPTPRAASEAPETPPGTYGMGAAGQPGTSPAPPLGTAGTGVAAPPANLQTPRSAGSWFRAAGDFLRSFAQKSFPALTRLSSETADGLARATNARWAAKASWELHSRTLKVGNEPLRNLTPEEQVELGTTWAEYRMRTARETLGQKAAQAKDPAEKAELEERRDQIKTFVGQKGSPLVDEATYQRNLEGLWSFFEAVKQDWTPEVEANLRDIKGLDPNDAIDSDTQIPGLPLNLIAVKPDAPGAVPAGAMTGQRGMGGLRVSKPGFTRQASLDAEAYDTNIFHMMQRTLALGIKAAARANAARAGLESGTLVAVKGSEAPPEGFKYLGLDPTKGIGLDPSARYYAHPEAYGDFVRGFEIGERGAATAAATGLKPLTDVVYNVALMSPVELAVHTANHVTAMFRPGMGTPLANLAKSFRNGYKILGGDPVILGKIRDLAHMSAAFGHEPRPGLAASLIGLGKYIPGASPEAVESFGERASRYDPTRYINQFTSRFIDVMQKSVRVQLGDAYDKMVEAGKFPKSESAKRDFINQALGNYNAQAANPLAQFLRDSGLQSFATAAHTFTAQGVKSVLGTAVNAPATSTRAMLAIRGMGALKLLPMLVVGPVVNLLAWGNAFPSDVPAFTVKVSDDEQKARFFDPLAFTGMRRGAKTIGLNAVIEGSRQGQTAGQIADRALLHEIPLQIEHLFAGPPVQAVHTFLTGEDALGRRVAPQVSKATTPAGMMAAQQKGLPPAGSSQAYQNAKAALFGVNPIAKTMTQPEKTPRTWVENMLQSFGPFGVKTINKPPVKTKAGGRRR